MNKNNGIIHPSTFRQLKINQKRLHGAAYTVPIQESIPVGCVPTTKVASILGGVHTPIPYPPIPYPWIHTPYYSQERTRDHRYPKPWKDLVPGIPYPSRVDRQHLWKHYLLAMLLAVDNEWGTFTWCGIPCTNITFKHPDGGAYTVPIIIKEHLPGAAYTVPISHLNTPTVEPATKFIAFSTLWAGNRWASYTWKMLQTREHLS